MKSKYSISQEKIYVFGFSAGGYMANNLLASYPDVFDGGAIIAGGPYKVADSLQDSYGVMISCPDRSPQEWGDFVRGAFSYTGDYPRVSIWHGARDTVVDISNMRESMEQWTNVHGIDPVPDRIGEFRGHTHKVYFDEEGKPVVETWTVLGMGHDISVDPGDGKDEGGTVGRYTSDYGIYSFYHAAKFLEIIPSG